MADHSFDELVFQLNEAHRLINKAFFANKLAPIKITIDGKKRTDSPVLGFFKSGGTQFAGDEAVITIVTQALNGIPFDILTVLVHEMIHQYCYEQDLVDTYATSSRHNKNFKKVAESIGWQYDDIKVMDEEQKMMRQKYGFAHADSYSEHYSDVLLNLDIDYNLIKASHHADANSYQRKGYNYEIFYCPGCGVKLKSQRQLNIRCLDCDKNFIKKQ